MRDFPAFLGIVLMVLTLPGTLELIFLTLSGLIPRRLLQTPESSSRLNLCVVIPAHNEEINIPACIDSLYNCETGGHQITIVIVADNCTDSTAQIARLRGIRVIERHDALLHGKGYALNHAFALLLQEDHDAFLVVDADTEVETNFVQAMAVMFLQGADALQCRYLVRNTHDSIHVRLMQIAWVAFNILRLRGRDSWGLSVGILGNGFALTRNTLLQVPFEAFSIAEDLEYHLKLVQCGSRVRYCGSTTVWSDTPKRGKAAADQIARWDGGRFRAISEQIIPLATEIIKGRFILLEPLFDLLLLPLAFHVTLLLFLLALPYPLGRTMALIGLGCVGLHVVSAIFIERLGWRELLVLLYGPLYILWKLVHGKHIITFSNRAAVWKRTERIKDHK
jgi:cellulose synthase/poly-beta-1,6-N-acetylglucosamine synthase-like glycosyltransferase